MKKKKASNKSQKRSACALPQVGQIVRVGAEEEARLTGTDLFTDIALVVEQGFAVADETRVVERVWEASPGGYTDYQVCVLTFDTGQVVRLQLSRNQMNPKTEKE